MTTCFFKQRLAIARKVEAKQANLLLTGVTTTPRVAAYTVNPISDSFAVIPTPVLEGYIQEAKYSLDGNFLVTSTGASPYVTLYRRDAATGEYVKVADSDVKATYITAKPGVKAISFTDDGSLLCISHASKAFVVFQRSADGLTYRFLFQTNGTVGSNVSAISPDGNTVAIMATTDQVHIYKRTNATTWTYVTMYDIGLSSGNITAMAWAPDSAMLFVTTSVSSPALVVLTWNGTTLSQLQRVRDTGGPRSVSVNRTAYHVAYGGGTNASPTFTVYKWFPGQPYWTTLTVGNVPGAVNNVDFSPDGTYLAVGYGRSTTGVSSKLNVYRRAGDTYTLVATGIPNDDVTTGWAPYFGPAV